MFRAIGRWLKAVGYLFTGRIDAARRALDTNPHVVRAKYEDIIREKTDRIQQYKQAVAGLIAQQENKMAKVKALTEEVGRLERLKAGALAKAKQSVEKLQKAGKSKDEIQTDVDYQKCLSAFNDFSSTLGEKQDRIAELEHDIEDYHKRIGEHKVQLQQLLREIDGLKSEAADAVADMITAKQEKEIGDTLAGIAKDGTAEELQRMRQLRQEVKAEAKISKELSGVESKAQEAEFLEYARTSSANSEFDALVGLGEEKESATPSRESRGSEGASRLPE
ncbi:MAG: PspA/IM30 family protein [Planctomycetota bacterium]|jgi:chromosome segregation ATPase